MNDLLLSRVESLQSSGRVAVSGADRTASPSAPLATAGPGIAAPAVAVQSASASVVVTPPRQRGTRASEASIVDMKPVGAFGAIVDGVPPYPRTPSSSSVCCLIVVGVPWVCLCRDVV